MQQHTQGFTLIELLVAILVIGILAAVAVPQYQRAVLKSRITAALTYVKTMKDAEERYYLANGEYTAEVTELDVEADCPVLWRCGLDATIDTALADMYDNNGNHVVDIVYSFDYRTDKRYAGVLHCTAFNTMAEQICSSMGTFLGRESNVSRYKLN